MAQDQRVHEVVDGGLELPALLEHGFRSGITMSGRPAPEGWDGAVAALHDLLDAFAASHPDPELVAEATATITELAGRFAAAEVPEDDRPLGRPLLPPYTMTMIGDTKLTGTVTFGPHYNGRAAVHGGAIPLLFDEILGRLSLIAGRTGSRTAYLHVDYRSLTPVGRELQLTAEVDRIEGRKRFVRGALYDGDRLCCEIDALMVQPRPR